MLGLLGALESFSGKFSGEVFREVFVEWATMSYTSREPFTMIHEEGVGLIVKHTWTRAILIIRENLGSRAELILNHGNSHSKVE